MRSFMQQLALVLLSALAFVAASSRVRAWGPFPGMTPQSSPTLTASPKRLPPSVTAGPAAGATAPPAELPPLHRADGTSLGVIGFAWAEPPRFDVKLENALRAVAVLCTETIERAERYDDEHRLIVELQRRLLGELPQLPGIDAAARYLPAGRSATVGGDWDCVTGARGVAAMAAMPTTAIPVAATPASERVCACIVAPIYRRLYKPHGLRARWVQAQATQARARR